MNSVSQAEKTGSCSFILNVKKHGLLNNGLHSIRLNLDHGCYLQEQVDMFRESNTDHLVQLGYIAWGVVAHLCVSSVKTVNVVRCPLNS